MSKYLLELKNRFILLFVSWVSVIFVSYFYKETLLFLFIEPDYVFNTFNMKSPFSYFIFTDILEIFSVYIQLILFLSLQVLFIFLIYHFFVFLSPGLFFFEYYRLNLVLKIIIIIWFLSVIVSKYILIPLTWNFFLSFQNMNSLTLHFEAKLNEYLNFYISFYYLCFFYSQIFTILLFFFSYANKNVSVIKKFRKLYYYFFILFSTLISPPEIFSQILISLFLIFFYELFIFINLLKLVINFLIRQPIETNKNSNSE